MLWITWFVNLDHGLNPGSKDSVFEPHGLILQYLATYFLSSPFLGVNLCSFPKFFENIFIYFIYFILAMLGLCC